MIKICFITTVSITLKCFVVDIAKYLYEQGDFDITFICNPDEEFQKQLPSYIRFIPVQMERGISVSGISAMLKMKKIFKNEKFDIIQYSTPNAALYASLAGKLTKVPIRLYCQWGMAFVGFKGIKRKIFKIVEKLVCSLSTWIEPDSHSNLEYAHEQKLYPDNKGAVIWNGSACGVDLNKFDVSKKEEYRNIIRNKYQIPYDAFVYGFVGRITRDKGINELFESFKMITSSHTNSYLLMVGPEEDDSNIDNGLYEWIRKNSNVIFTGYTNVVEQYLSAMDCYVLPSYREGFGMGVVEAEAMGVPVIVTNIPGPIDAMINKKTGIIVEKADVQSLKSAMEELRTDITLCKTYGKCGMEYARENFEQKKLFEYIVADRRKLIEK